MEPLVPIKHEGPPACRLQTGSSCQVPSTAAFTLFYQVNVAVLPPCHLHRCLSFTCHCSQCYLNPATRFTWQVLDGSTQSFVTVPFPSFWPWHCVVHAPALLFPPGIRCRAGGWHIVHEAARLATCSSMTLLPSSQSHLLELFCCSCLSLCDAQLEPMSSGRTHVLRTVAFLSRVHIRQACEHFLL